MGLQPDDRPHGRKVRPGDTVPSASHIQMNGQPSCGVPARCLGRGELEHRRPRGQLAKSATRAANSSGVARQMPSSSALPRWAPAPSRATTGVRQTAAGTIVPIEFRTATKTHRFWVAHTDRERYSDLLSDDTRLPPLQEEDAQPAPSASRNRPTCQPGLTAAAPATSTSNPLSFIPTQSVASDVEIAASEPDSRADTAAAESTSGLSATLISLQQAADAEHARLRELTDNDERRRQRQTWFEAAAAVQAAVTGFARTKRRNRHEVEQELRRVVRRSK